MSEEKTCKELCALLSDYLDGDLGKSECVEIHEHLKVCPICGLVYKSLWLSVKACAAGITEEIPADVRTRLLLFLKKHCVKE